MNYAHHHCQLSDRPFHFHFHFQEVCRTSLSIARRLLGMLIALALLANPASVRPGPPFEAEGTIEFHNYLRASGVSDPPLRFLMIVSNDCWFARLSPVQPTAFDYQEAAYDGTNLYHLVRLHLPPGQSSKNVATARIFNNQQVVYDLLGHPIGPLWLMLASSSTLRGSKDNRVPPVVTLGLFEIELYHQRPFLQRAYWQIQDDYPNLPLSAVYLDDGETKTSPQFAPAKRNPPFDKGFTNVTYRVLEQSDISGFRVPSLAQLDTFRPDLRGEPALIHYTKYLARVERWSTNIQSIPFLPKLPGATVISDGRVFATAGVHTYLAGQNWPTLEAVTNLPGFREKVRATKLSRSEWNPPAPGQGRAWIVRVTLILLFLIWPGWFLLHHLRTYLSRKTRNK